MNDDVFYVYTMAPLFLFRMMENNRIWLHFDTSQLLYLDGSFLCQHVILLCFSRHSKRGETYCRCIKKYLEPHEWQLTVIEKQEGP